MSLSVRMLSLFRKTKMCDLDLKKVAVEQQELKISPVHNTNTTVKTATFGMGCFWGAESLYGGTKGVLRTTVGYAGGSTNIPTYRNIGDHTEVLEIDYDPNVISFKQLLHLFWNNHEYGLTTKVKQQYISLILYHDEEQKSIAEASKEEQKKKRAPEVLITKICEKKTFYPAEDYHQKYRLQGHKDLTKSLNLNSKLLLTSYVATKLNGYLAGVGGLAQFNAEADTLGLTPSQKSYCSYYTEKNEGGGLYC
ncbi:peptide methionine sulfoxide reductase [Teleopsis dalmanni]|uniref:peptide methionine sulfoxide reductase n=1 Tax=Teleopsis dalmanni TaxID=139649 RepID=UPI0018CD8B30|nr:peptide methionine sulfoxide reductase [Teleopsis dalmanni]XP_037938818.1 peptide methionine sulfoxide reductase [Teleopsis dalmanni]XP_037938819.1 peptide methionine sulfoxide reductase [Teleopsis dalmanni]XP_037938820.1 peptide methionine sulfoxide reductase [Teleopsis dalmanni]